MEEKKKLKKLVLKKEEIVNLNDYQMRQIQGGSISGVISKVSKYTVEITISEVVSQALESADAYMREHSWYGCAPEPQISEEQYMGGCLLPEIEVRPYP